MLIDSRHTYRLAPSESDIINYYPAYANTFTTPQISNFVKKWAGSELPMRRIILNNYVSFPDSKVSDFLSKSRICNTVWSNVVLDLLLWPSYTKRSQSDKINWMGFLLPFVSRLVHVWYGMRRKHVWIGMRYFYYKKWSNLNGLLSKLASLRNDFPGDGCYRLVHRFESSLDAFTCPATSNLRILVIRYS